MNDHADSTASRDPAAPAESSAASAAVAASSRTHLLRIAPRLAKIVSID